MKQLRYSPLSVGPGLCSRDIHLPLCHLYMLHTSITMCGLPITHNHILFTNVYPFCSRQFQNNFQNNLIQLELTTNSSDPSEAKIIKLILLKDNKQKNLLRMGVFLQLIKTRVVLWSSNSVPGARFLLGRFKTSKSICHFFCTLRRTRG